MKNKQINQFVSATENYKIEHGTYDFLICKNWDSENNRTIKIKCKFLKTALRKIVDRIDSNEESIDYEVAVDNPKGTTFISLHGLKDHPIRYYLG